MYHYAKLLSQRIFLPLLRLTSKLLFATARGHMASIITRAP